MSSRNKKYEIGSVENKKFLEETRENLLNFGRKFLSPGGSSYYLGDDGNPWKNKNRETWITSRMIHVYSIGTMLDYTGSSELVDGALKGLCGELKDRINGGWYSGLTPEQGILPNKQCYAHAFVILAASSAMLAGKSKADELLREALEVFDLRFWNEEDGLAYDTWDTDFKVLEEYRGINANMHTVEAFLAVADVTGDEKYRLRSGRIIEHVIQWSACNEWRIPEHFTKEWIPNLDYNKEKPTDPFKPYGATPGHGIEWARLIIQWALSYWKENKDKTKYYIEVAENLYNRAVEDAWNVDGEAGIVYTTDWRGKPIVHDRMHWTLAEAINTSSVLWNITKKEKYSEDYKKYMRYLDEKVIDYKNGSWFHQLDIHNNVIGTVWPGKSDIYHALQATWIPYGTPEISIASDVERRMRYL